MQLGLVVLIKHAFAGKVILYGDIVTVLGKNVVKYVGKRKVKLLLAWLQANKRSDIKFQTTSHTHIDAGKFNRQFRSNYQILFILALQKLLSYFPQLAIKYSEEQHVNYSSLHSRDNDKMFNVDDSTAPTSQAKSSLYIDDSIKAPMCVRYVWLDRHRVSKICRDPEIFEPNVNILWL